MSGQNGKPKSYDAAHLLSLAIEPPNWQVVGICERGDTVVLAAPPAHGKTILGLQAAISVASGSEVWGGIETRLRGKVAYVDAEMGWRRAHRYLTRLCTGMELDPEELKDRLHLWGRGFLLDDEAEWELLATELESFTQGEPLDLLVLDSLRRHLEGDEGDSGSIAKLFRHVEQLQARLGGPTVLLQHHNRKRSKDDTSDPAERVRGSTDIWAACDVLLTVDSKQDGKLRILNPKNRSGELEPFVVRLDGWVGAPKNDAERIGPLRLVYEGDLFEALTEGIQSQQNIAAYLRSCPEKRATRQQIAAGANVSERTVNRSLRALMDQGLVGKTDTRPVIWYLADLVERSLLED